MSKTPFGDSFDPPPSYEEATAGSNNRQRPPPPTPPAPPRKDTGQGPGNGEGSDEKQSAQQAAQPPPSPGAPLQVPGAPGTPGPSPVAPSVTRQFPPVFNLYRSAWPSQAYHIGEHQQTPLYSLVAHSKWSPAPELVLHNGPGDRFPPLATANYDYLERFLEVTLPPLPGAALPTPVKVQMPSVLDATWSFTIEVPWPSPAPGGKPAFRREPYSWRRSHSLAVNGLGGEAHGWKLVRLSNDLPPGGLLVAGSGPPSGDGHEVVAVCTNAVMSVTKLWKFAFLGSGVTGVLGERWAVMAVMTGLAIWDRESRY